MLCKLEIQIVPVEMIRGHDSPLNFFSSFLVCRLGGENLAVAQNAYAVIWFKGKELNMVFGMLLSISRLVSEHAANMQREVATSVCVCYQLTHLMCEMASGMKHQ